ncbi:MAG: TIGR02281 family clan AA aspartic protease [Pseudomonadota bacterium]
MRTKCLAIFSLAIALSSALSTSNSAAESLQLIVTGEDRAIVLLGTERIILTPSADRHPRVTLIEATSDAAIVEVDGKRVTLSPGNDTAAVFAEQYEPAETGDETLTLWADSTGFFYANGRVNNRPIRFLVDTGANTVTFSSRQADGLGLDYEKGESGYASTASGVTPMKTFKVNEISIEHIKLYNVRVTVIPGAFPDIPLLGGTFLNKLNMVREGNKMELTKRGY